MTIKLIGASMGLLFAFASYASTYDVFVDSLREEYFTNLTARGKELHRHTRVKPFNWIMRRLNPDAVATYNDKLNTVSLNEDYLTKPGGSWRIKSVAQIEGRQRSFYKTSTIFHEMGHAEMDVFVENEREIEDRDLYQYYRHVLQNFYKKSFPRFKSKHLFHEHFGYYRSELIEKIANEVDDVLLQNGFNRFSGTCFATPGLRSLVENGIELEEFQQIHLFGQDRQYRREVGLDYIFFKGKDIHIKAPSVNQNIVKNIELMFWQYHKAFYDFPASRRELVERMNSRSRHKEKLADCREKLWRELQ